MGKLKITKKHSRWVRWTHWVNFPLLALMIWSGIWIYWANDVYKPFFPAGFYKIFGVDHHLAIGMAVHFAVMWVFAINGLVSFLYLAISGEWRELWPGHRSVMDAIQVFLHDLGLRKSTPSQGKFNAAQRLAYTGINLIGVGSILSGLAIYKPVQLHWLTSMLGGYESARLIHFICMLLFFPFFLVHIIQVVRAGWNNFRGMLTGYEVTKIK